jgi:hypothetical protein
MMTGMMKDAAGPGRGRRMSRQRKREAVLRNGSSLSRILCSRQKCGQSWIIKRSKK